VGRRFTAKGTRTRRTRAVAGTVIALLALSAQPASAALLQDTEGRPFTGPISLTALGPVTANSSAGAIVCNESSSLGAISDSGSLADPAFGRLDTFDATNNGSQSCPDTLPLGIDHVDTVADALPWGSRVDWISNNTAGQPNGVMTISQFAATITATGGFTCSDVADLTVDIYNPDNTPSGRTELRFEAEPLTLVGGSPECPNDPTLTGTYALTGQRESGEVVNLEVRGADTPVPNETVGVAVVKGKVRIKLPGSQDFQLLEGPTEIPLGTEVDTTEGTVELASAKNGDGDIRTGEFWNGVFEVGQSGPTKKLTTVLKLVPDVGCGKRASAEARGNGLWGSEKGGGHKTSGNKGSGSTRGTIWFVGDRCNGTTQAKVKEGRVAFRDFVKNKTVILRAGDNYVAGK
jgi:hypothetical protein